MTRTITLKKGVAHLGGQAATDLISNTELAERLEIAEEVLHLRDQVKAQQHTIDQLEETGPLQMNKLQLNEGDLVVLPEAIEDSTIQVLVNHARDTLGLQQIGFVMGSIETLSAEDKAALVAEQIEEKVAGTRAKLAETLQELQQLKDYNTELKHGGDQLGQQLDSAKEDNRVLAINLTTAERKVQQLQEELTAASKLIKDLKKLNPERLKKQVAELKKSNKVKQDSIEGLRTQCDKYIRDNQDKAKTITKLDLALEKACDDINAQNTPEPLEEINLGALGKWQIFGTRQIDRYDVMDLNNNVSMRLQIQNGQVICPEVRTPPKNLLKMLITRAARYRATEQKIADDQKPLETGVK